MPRQDHLRRQLAAFVPATATEDAHKQRILTLLETTEQPLSRAQYTPGHVTTSAFVTTRDRSAVLLILHKKLQRWLQPGGHLEPDDSDVLAGARREVREETGLEALELAVPGLFDVDVHAIPAFGDQPAHQHFDVRFLFSTDAHQPHAGSDAGAARWIPITQLLAAATDAAYPSDESVLRALRKLRELV